MQADQYSRTALAVAFIRAQHHLRDEPKLLDDPYAHRLLTAAEMAAFAETYVQLELGVAPGDPETVLPRALREITPAANALARARYTEDRLAMAMARGVAQYVLDCPRAQCPNDALHRVEAVHGGVPAPAPRMTCTPACFTHRTGRWCCRVRHVP